MKTDYVQTMNLNFMTVNLKIISVIFICLISSIYSEYNPHEIDITGVSVAIAQVCEEFFIKKSTNFDILIYGEVTLHLSYVIDRFLELIVSKAPINLQHIQNMTSFNHKLKKSAVIFFKSDLNKFNNTAELVNNHPSDIKFLLYSEMHFNKDPVVIRYNNDITEFKSHLYFFANVNKNVIFYTYDNFLA